MSKFKKKKAKKQTKKTLSAKKPESLIQLGKC